MIQTRTITDFLLCVTISSKYLNQAVLSVAAENPIQVKTLPGFQLLQFDLFTAGQNPDQWLRHRSFNKCIFKYKFW